MRKWVLSSLNTPENLEDNDHFFKEIEEKISIFQPNFEKKVKEEGFVEGVQKASETNSAYLVQIAKTLQLRLGEMDTKFLNLSQMVHVEALKIAKKLWVRFFPKIDELLAMDNLENLVKEAHKIKQESLKFKLLVAPTRYEEVKKWLNDSKLSDRIILDQDPKFSRNDSSIEWENGGMDYISQRLFDQIEQEFNNKEEK